MDSDRDFRETVIVSGFQVLCGVWLIFAPFVLGYRALTSALTNDLIIGIIVLIVGLIETQTAEHAPMRTA